MTAPAYDAVIAGGGLAGLSLAAHLATGGWPDRAVLIVDDPAAAHADSWGFWSAGRDLLDPAVSRRYRQIRAYAAGRSAVLPIDPYRYQVVRRPDLRRVVEGLTADFPGLVYRVGRVESVRDGEDRVEVVVDGQRISAAWVFDSVTADPAAGAPDARLAFTGWEVACRNPVFDPDSPILFDFRASTGGRARFGYVRPDDDRRALVELTEFVPRRCQPPDAGARETALDGYLTGVLGCSGYRVERVESAVLPLYARKPRRRRGRRVLAIGARGGLVKASTGYGYQRIQRDSRAVVDSLSRHDHPFEVTGSRLRHRLLDAVLLDLLDREPAQLERVFAELFFDCQVGTVLSFLDEATSPLDELRLIAALTPAPFLRAAADRARRSLVHARWRPFRRRPGS